jgi:hypothetical protein
MTAEPEKIETMITARADTPPDKTELHTERGGEHLHVVVRAMTPLAQVAVRFARTYIQGLIGFLLLGLASASTLANVGVVVQPGDFLSALKVAAGLALAPAVISLLQNLAELLARVDEKYPMARA